MTRTGRPKTGPGHRDDALLEMLEFRGEIAEFLKMLQAHYRVERDALTSIDEHLREAALSWRYGEIVDAQMAAAS